MNVYQKITDEVIDQLNNGTVPWERPFRNGETRAVNYVSGRPYSLLNSLLLKRGGEYLTFNQIQELGGRVRQGAKAQFVIFFKRVTHNTVVDGVEVEEGFPLLRYYNVFHIEDVEGIEPHEGVGLHPAYSSSFDTDGVIDEYLSHEDIGMEYNNGEQGFYFPASDRISVPRRETFRDSASYYSSLLHQIIHSTGAASRLDRGIDSEDFGRDEFTREELVALMGSIMAANILGVETPQTRADNISFISGWVQALRNDPKMIVWAAGRAEKAVDYFLRSDESATPVLS